MWGDPRVNCVLFYLFYLGGGVLGLHCKHTAVHSHPEQWDQADREEDC
ncbi:unnamed protein product [Staurois parvus]|uniref:Uncharacterized protein n=1 Tax=Staurois parvus TaxID=386267 RepID=A0ABN9CD58_9NEOB|nr:unnamed protein product [Staurois parvus]